MEKNNDLYKDLCGRLPYHVVFRYSDGKNYTLDSIDNNGIINGGFPISECRPYLRPMSTMTEDERREWHSRMITETFEQYPCSAAPMPITENFPTAESFDWLKEKHFDYYGLIPEGLAIDMTNELVIRSDKPIQ